MAYLALDIGKKRTGIAVADAESRVPVSLKTHSGSFSNFCRDRLPALLQQHNPTTLIIGLPLLPNGSEGAQALFVRKCIQQLEEFVPKSLKIYTEDERFTSVSSPKFADKDANAALEIAEQYLQKEK